MAKRQSTLKKKVSKRQTRKFSKKGGSKKGGSKKGGSKKNWGGQRWKNALKLKAKRVGIDWGILLDMEIMQINIPPNTGGPVNAKDRKNAFQIIIKAVKSLKARFNMFGTTTRINKNNINELIAYASQQGYTRSPSTSPYLPSTLELLLEKSKENGLELSKDNQELANKYLEQEPPLPQEEQLSEEQP